MWVHWCPTYKVESFLFNTPKGGIIDV